MEQQSGRAESDRTFRAGAVHAAPDGAMMTGRSGVRWAEMGMVLLGPGLSLAQDFAGRGKLLGNSSMQEVPRSHRPYWCCSSPRPLRRAMPTGTRRMPQSPAPSAPCDASPMSRQGPALRTRHRRLGRHQPVIRRYDREIRHRPVRNHQNRPDHPSDMAGLPPRQGPSTKPTMASGACMAVLRL